MAVQHLNAATPLYIFSESSYLYQSKGPLPLGDDELKLKFSADSAQTMALTCRNTAKNWSIYWHDRLVQEQLIQTAGRINFIYRMLLGKCQVKKVWKQSYKDKLVIACFTQIVLGTTTRSLGDPQQIPLWRFQLAISVQHRLCWTETNPPQHAGNWLYNTVKWIFFSPAAGFAFSET